MHFTPPPRSPTADDGTIYPSGDNRPLAETPIHRRNLVTLIDVLDRRFAGDPLIYVSGNMFIYYVKGDKWKHVSPDVFLVRGVPKDKPRDSYFVWEEGRAPDLVIELTSASTRDEDIDQKKWLYQNMLYVAEYVLFDPRGEYLDPPLQGFRLERGDYVAIAEIDGRLPSEVTGLHFEANGEDLRVYDPSAARWLPTASELLDEAAAERQRLSAERQRLSAERQRLSEERDRVAEERDRVEIDNERLREELLELRRRLGQTEKEEGR
jgi:Uma2 family endonuclease